MIKSVEIENFKAIQKGKVDLTPLTCFIGYNGVGKSSLLEALETYKVIVTEGLNAGMAMHRGFEHIYYKGEKEKRWFGEGDERVEVAAIHFGLSIEDDVFIGRISSDVSQEINGKQKTYFQEELLSGIYDAGNRIDSLSNKDFLIDISRKNEVDIAFKLHNQVVHRSLVHPDQSLMNQQGTMKGIFQSWQFLNMNTFLMGNPTPQKRTGGEIVLAKDGSNIAEYLLEIREASPEVFEGIIETLQYVLPYAQDLQPSLTSELERLVYVQLSEENFKVPGWLLSTGTLKLLALLAVFRNPNPSPLIVIEELENGLDPRSINLIVNEIREFVKDKDSQVIITTHSPYLLDLLHLSQIVFVEREEGKVVFKRPYDSEQLKAWSKEYTIGEMYTKELIQRFS
jgi:predicted ATPase